MSDWTDEEKQQVIDKYNESNPTPDTSVEIVKEIADEIGKTPNGVRMILSKANVYIKKDPSTSKGESTEDKPKKESKADSISRLKSVIDGNGFEVDDAIIDKLTGKAAAYFADLFTETQEDES